MRTRVRRVRILLAVLGASAMLACQGSSAPEPNLPFAKSRADDGTNDEPFSNLMLTLAVERLAIRKPPLARSVDAQIAAMLAHVKRYGRGELDRATLEATRVGGEARPLDEELERLSTAASLLASYLHLDRGQVELADVATAALQRELGDDASIWNTDPSAPEGSADLVPELRDGIGVLWLRHMGDDMGDRVLALLSHWSGSAQPPRAVVLDLSDCGLGEPRAAVRVVSAFAGRARALGLVFRDAKSGGMKTQAWGGEAAERVPRYRYGKLFIVTSSRTGSVAEAVVESLRSHRNARVLGGVTKGTGRLTHLLPIRDAVWFGFTVADVLDFSGRPMRNRPLIPDACPGAAGFETLRERTLPAYREQCGEERDVHREALFEYVGSVLAAEPPAPPSGGSVLEKGAEHT